MQPQSEHEIDPLLFLEVFFFNEGGGRLLYVPQNTEQ